MQYTEIANKILEENQLYKIFGTTFYEVCIIINLFIVPHKTHYMHEKIGANCVFNAYSYYDEYGSTIMYYNWIK